jgi:hypothetical protein|tara:strand:- start:1066 stop:2502 length:1437 start_codon:yes stop_codon:yes gene_type:complete
MGILQHGAAIPSGASAYEIGNSIKFESDNTESLTKSQTASNRKTWTVSFWFKRTEINSALQYVFEAGSSGSTLLSLFINGTTDWRIYDYVSGSRKLGFFSTASLSDPSAWYHIVLACDTTQGTAANRFKIYLNGEDLTAISGYFSTAQYPDQNYETNINNSGATLSIGKAPTASTNFCGYISEFNFIDGLMKDASDFGKYNSSGIWQPIEYTGSYGNQGYFLNFADAGDLGDDESGNGKDFTENNITAVDQATDTPTNNFCTLNPLIPYAVQSGTPVINEGATFHNGSGGWTGMKGTIGVTKGKWYWELSMGGAGGGASVIHGIQTVNSDSGESTATSAHNLLETAAWYVSGGHWIKDYTNGRDDIAASAVTHSPSNTVVYAVALNMDDGEITYYANGSVVSGLNEVNLDGLADTRYSGAIVAPFASVYNQQLAWNFGGRTTLSISSAATDANGYGTFEYAPPSGYYALCTKNLAEFG